MEGGGIPVTMQVSSRCSPSYNRGVPSIWWTFGGTGKTDGGVIETFEHCTKNKFIHNFILKIISFLHQIKYNIK